MSSIRVSYFSENDAYVYAVSDPENGVEQFLEDHPPETAIIIERKENSTNNWPKGYSELYCDKLMVISWLNKNISMLFKMTFIGSEFYTCDKVAMQTSTLRDILEFLAKEYAEKYLNFDIITSKIDGSII